MLQPIHWSQLGLPLMDEVYLQETLIEKGISSHKRKSDVLDDDNEDIEPKMKKIKETETPSWLVVPALGFVIFGVVITGRLLGLVLHF